MRQFCIKNETILHKKWELQAIYFKSFNIDYISK